ncbi:membrane protein [Hymenobacter glacieicola]|uniref:Membrane protein n=1 Tax=Hymenobacter glacieicola TaxID=1562124 RepID=A0ABQ1WRL8_9BACT|nr:membrane protein [Hymenobacter glacieicola]
MVYVAPRGATYILIDDNLDTELAPPFALLQEGKALDYRSATVVERLMNGLPRNALRPGLQPLVGLMALLDPLPAYLLHELLVRLAGLVGMYLLLRRYGLPGAGRATLCAALALAWAVLPTYTAYGVSVLGQPWVVLALLNLRRGRGHWSDWLMLVGFALWSSLVLTGLFVLAVAALVLIWDAVRYGQVAWRPVLGVGLLALSYLLVEYPLVYSLLIERQFVSHRVEFDYARLAPGGVGAGLSGAARYFGLGQYHAGLFPRAAPLLAAGLALAYRPASPARQQLAQRLMLSLSILVVVALFCGFYPQLIGVAQRVVPLLRAFNLSRIHFLTPLLWFGVLVLSLRYLPPGRLPLVLVGLQLLIGLGMNPEWTLNVRRLLGRLPATEPTYAAYVAPALFARIQQDIQARTGQRPAQYRVACLGFAPAVATLNGFYTLDAYQNNYPLRYKRQFRPLIAAELAKSPALQTYFDAWGNRCYLFSAELGKNFRVGAFPARVVNEWAFDARAFHRLGGRYVLSAAKLRHPARSGLQLLESRTAPGAYWRIWVYQVRN